MSMSAERNEVGQYSEKLEAICACGHRKGEHDAASKGHSAGACQSCRDCDRFVKVKARRGTGDFLSGN
jgi:hypothetical protein